MNICAIDPGKTGAIAFYTSKGSVSSIKMPDTPSEIWNQIINLKETYGSFIVFIERVQMWVQDSLDVNKGKQFRISKMVSDYDTLIAMFEVNKIPVVQVAPTTWQKEMDLYHPKKDKTQRKNLYKRFAARKYPGIKVTLTNADALCILSFSRQRTVTSPDWVLKNIKNKESLRQLKLI